MVGTSKLWVKHSIFAQHDFTPDRSLPVTFEITQVQQYAKVTTGFASLDSTIPPEFDIIPSWSQGSELLNVDQDRRWPAVRMGYTISPEFRVAC